METKPQPKSVYSVLVHRDVSWAGFTLGYTVWYHLENEAPMKGQLVSANVHATSAYAVKAALEAGQ